MNIERLLNKYDNIINYLADDVEPEFHSMLPNEDMMLDDTRGDYWTEDDARMLKYCENDLNDIVDYLEGMVNEIKNNHLNFIESEIDRYYRNQ